jgi:hypothetical protein
MLTHVIVLRTKYIARKRVLVWNTAVIQWSLAVKHQSMNFYAEGLFEGLNTNTFSMAKDYYNHALEYQYANYGKKT